MVAQPAKLNERELGSSHALYLKIFPSRTGFPSTVVSLHHISVTRALSSSDTGVATLVQSYLVRNNGVVHQMSAGKAATCRQVQDAALPSPRTWGIPPVLQNVGFSQGLQYTASHQLASSFASTMGWMLCPRMSHAPDTSSSSPSLPVICMHLQVTRAKHETAGR